jgi:hypothetical protein
MDRALSKKIRIQLGEWSEEMELWNIAPEDYRQHAVEFMKWRSQHEADTLWNNILEVEEIREEQHGKFRLQEAD